MVLSTSGCAVRLYQQKAPGGFMDRSVQNNTHRGRRTFFKEAVAGVAAAGAVLSGGDCCAAPALSEKEKLARIEAKSMRVNTGGPRIVPSPTATTGYPRNDEVVELLKNAIESFREMADYGGKVGVKVTIENHWGLSAEPMNVRIILEEANHPFCEASPDFCNWEHESMLFHALEALAPCTHTTVHAKYWDRWPSNDVQRCVRILKRPNSRESTHSNTRPGPGTELRGPDTC
jgi:sugar phosphate isomerase/epimerase